MIEAVDKAIGFILLFLLLIIELLLYLKLHRRLIIKFPLISVIFLFSLILNIGTIYLGLPTTPYLQIFLIIFETIIFIMSGFEYYEAKKMR